MCCVIVVEVISFIFSFNIVIIITTTTIIITTTTTQVVKLGFLDDISQKSIKLSACYVLILNIKMPVIRSICRFNLQLHKFVKEILVWNVASNLI